MNKYMILITPKDDIKVVPFTKFEDVKKAVDGYADTVLMGDYHFKKTEETITYHMLCNDDFATIPDADFKPNALVSMLYNQLIIGNVVIVKLVSGSDGFSDDGFSLEEANELQSDLVKLTENQLVYRTMSLIRRRNGVE